MRIRAVALTLALASSTAVAGPIAPIIGGTAATKGEFPTVVAVVIQAPGAQSGSICTGTLITPNWVMTAGHCTSPNILGLANQAAVTADTYVLFDTLNIDQAGGQTIMAKQTIMNPGYDDNPNDPGANDDVGLIELMTPVTDRVPVPLNRATANAPVSGLHLQMIGYGINTPNTNDAGVEYVLADKVTQSCAAIGAGLSDTNLLCWFQGGSGTATTGKCEGDSGGPSFTVIDGKKFQVGVTSIGLEQTGETTCNGYGADTRVDHVIAWLDQTVGTELACASDSFCNTTCAANTDPDCPNCTKDTDCTTAGDICDMGHCAPAPCDGGSGGSGSGEGCTCSGGSDCFSTTCGNAGSDHFCTESCDTTNNQCPPDFTCLSAGNASDPKAGFCWPGSGSSGDSGGGGGGCSTSTGGSGSGSMLFLLSLGAALFVARRRRARA